MKAKEVLTLLGITRTTLSSYVKSKKISVITLHNGQYDYDKESVFKLINLKQKRKNVIYARVSTSSQKKDLENQIEIISTFMNKNGISINKVYKEIASGMSLDRKEFINLLDDIIQYKVDKIFVTYKDRIARISFNMVNSICKRYGTEIIILDEINNKKTVEAEFLEEIVSLIHSFSMKMYSSRRKKKLELVAKDLSLEKDLKCI